MDQIEEVLKKSPILLETEDKISGNLFIEDGRFFFLTIGNNTELSNHELYSISNTGFPELKLFLSYPVGIPGLNGRTKYGVRGIMYSENHHHRVLAEDCLKIVQLIYDYDVVDPFSYLKLANTSKKQIDVGMGIKCRVKTERFAPEEKVIELASQKKNEIIIEFEKDNGLSFNIEEIDRLSFRTDACLTTLHRRPVTYSDIIARNVENSRRTDSFSVRLMQVREKRETDIFIPIGGNIDIPDMTQCLLIKDYDPVFIWKAFARANSDNHSFFEIRLYYLLVCADKLFELLKDTKEKESEREKGFEEFIKLIDKSTKDSNLSPRVKKVINYFKSSNTKKSYLTKDPYGAKLIKLFNEEKRKEEYYKLANQIRNDLMHRGMIGDYFWGRSDIYEFEDWLTDRVQKAVLDYLADCANKKYS